MYLLYCCGDRVQPVGDADQPNRDSGQDDCARGIHLAI
jgi:hypothetical protein